VEPADPHPALPRLAVYGSLRSNGGNHDRIADLGPPIAIGTARGTVEHFDGYPIFTPDDAGDEVEFEVYASPLLDDERLRDLDRWEGDMYRRIAIAVRCRDGTSITAMAYAGFATS
jgi:gamma-glutamylcyclotransferase (GGCT)/AIG2-like uncharacterized protein YtfP